MRVLDLLPNLKRLFEQADGPLGLAQGGVGIAQVAEGGPLAPPVADLARNRPVLLVEADGPLGLAQGGVGEAQVRSSGDTILNFSGLGMVSPELGLSPELGYPEWLQTLLVSASLGGYRRSPRKAG
ncbi:MAG TPA: hypothetical protein VJY15_17835 [Candidatus Acidoferrum sp.]|nr:hypothetical protein [Candidatus Acidoferrum sp.]